MQVANDVASANELPSCEAQAGALTTPLPESCRTASRALWSAVSLAESAFVAYEASSVASALAPWSAVTLASRCAAMKASVAREGRLVPVVSELCSAAMLLPCAATCPSVVARAAAVAVTRSSSDWMAAALLPEAAVFTARSVTCA